MSPLWQSACSSVRGQPHHTAALRIAVACGLDMAGGEGVQWHGLCRQGFGAPRPLQRLDLHARIQLSPFARGQGCCGCGPRDPWHRSADQEDPAVVVVGAACVVALSVTTGMTSQRSSYGIVGEQRALRVAVLEPIVHSRRPSSAPCVRLGARSSRLSPSSCVQRVLMCALGYDRWLPRLHPIYARVCRAAGLGCDPVACA